MVVSIHEIISVKKYRNRFEVCVYSFILKCRLFGDRIISLKMLSVQFKDFFFLLSKDHAINMIITGVGCDSKVLQYPFSPLAVKSAYHPRVRAVLNSEF